MTALGAIQLLFPVVLGLHTWEEFRQRDAFVRRSAMRRWAALTDTPALAGAAVLMMLSAVVASLAAYAGVASAARAIVEVAVFALLFNALGHVASSLVRREAVPGTLSAVGLVLPYAIAAVVVLHIGQGQPLPTLLEYAAVGALGMPLAALVFLVLGYVLTLPWRLRHAAHAGPGRDDASR